MPQLNKNEAARLRKVATHLEACMDALHRAQGELYPPSLKLYREDVQEVIENTQEVLKAVQRDLPARKPGPAPKAAQQPAAQGSFDDLEDEGQEA